MESSKKYKIWIACTLACTLLALAVPASAIVYTDPFFHYHAPLGRFAYPINNQRYQNDGITRHFSYDSIITGTSMTENFKKSEADEIFGADFIKVPFSGGSYKEIDSNVRRAFDAGKKLRYVIRCLDYSRLDDDKDIYREDMDFPFYLYNNNPFDDVSYLFNKTVLLQQTKAVWDYTAAGNKTTDFDAYSNWNAYYTFGAQTVFGTYTLPEAAQSDRVLTDEERERILGNIRQNVTSLADEHPETVFYYFFPPYSICYWHSQYVSGQTDWCIDVEQTAIEEILKHPNIKLFSFTDHFGLIGNLNNYKDTAHYGEWVNSWMLEWMHEGKHQLTKDNYQDYLDTISSYYQSYDYESLEEQRQLSGAGA